MIHQKSLYVLLLIPLISFSISNVFAENIIYRNASPIWYNYDCTDSSPSTWTQASPRVSNWQYFGYYDGNCYATLHTFDFTDMVNLENTTSILYKVDTKSMLLTDLTISNQYVVDCNLFYFGSPTITGGVISGSPTDYGNFDCTGKSANIQEITVNFTTPQITTFEGNIQGGTYSLSWMVFPNYNASMRSDLNSNGYTYAIGKYANEFDITGDGFDCTVIEASGWCNFYEQPWDAVKKALGEPYIGEWFYMLIFLPLPMSVFLLSRNGTYAGFVCLPIILAVNIIDDVVIQTSISMVLIALAFGVYETFRKKIFE